MNGPIELVCVDNQYHLFYPYNPTSKGMSTHLAHAVSQDLIHWEFLPIALYPDSLGVISSACIIVDDKNTSGFGSRGNPPLIAIYTYHNFEKEPSGSLEVESLGIAYSVDKGSTWVKYDHNPVIPSPGIRDFRHPNVCWDKQAQQWIMAVAADSRIHFYTSADLKKWSYASDFGKQLGSEHDLWQSPDLFQLQVKGTNEIKWVLMVSIGLGEIGEWVTGCFTGDFDNNNFIPDQTTPLWLDYGPDNSAGTTSSYMPDGRTIYIGWMNNWEYATEVPTQTWHGSLTFPRELALEKVNNYYTLALQPVKEIKELYGKQIKISDVTVVQDMERIGVYDITPQISFPLNHFEAVLQFNTEDMDRMGFAEKFGIKLSNKNGEYIIIVYDSFHHLFYVDRSRSMSVGFSESFINTHILPFSIDESKVLEFRMIVDKNSFELFTANGRVVMTDTFYPVSDFNQMGLFVENGKVTLDAISVTNLKSIWE